MWVLWTWFIHFVPKCVVLFIDIDECWGEVEGEWISLFVYVQWEYIQCDPHWSCLQLEAVHNPSSLHLVEHRFNTRLKSVNLSGLKCCGGPELLALWCSMWEESHSGPYTDPRHLMLEVALSLSSKCVHMFNVHNVMYSLKPFLCVHCIAMVFVQQ